MAKKTKKVSPQADPGDEHVEKTVVETPVMEKPLPKEKTDTWEIKDRHYYLTKELAPLSFQLQSSGIFFFDEEKGYERELKNTTNQRTPFVDEFPEKSTAQLSHIIFRNGVLHVPREKQVLQKLLSLYHPQRDLRYKEREYEQEAANEIDWIELELAAVTTAYEMELDMAEAILRADKGSKVSELSSKELKRDLLIYAKHNPGLFLELANDENVYLRNIGIKAVEGGMITLSADNRTFTWTSNGRKLLLVPFDEHPYSALAAWFKTDEGMEVYNTIEKRLV
tara:strand:- start:711 stop:1553 length:843 start_codon:yes stop_codon:yes gene_type:complete